MLFEYFGEYLLSNIYFVPISVAANMAFADQIFSSKKICTPGNINRTLRECC